MLACSKFLTGVTGLALAAAATSPAVAQPYPPYGYPSGPVDSTYGVYGAGADQFAVDRCSRAAVARTSRTSYTYARNNGYGYGERGAGIPRVVAISRVERRYNGGLKVFGLMDSGMGSNRAYGGPNTSQIADLVFDCRVDYRGNVTKVDINRNTARNYRDY